MTTVQKNKTIGCFELVDLPLLGVSGVWAKVDTGAFSGALHCTNIKVFRRGITRKRILKFTPLDSEWLAQETSDFHETYVRSASGHRQKRFIVETKITLSGQTYPIRIGLADRSELKRPVLLGRRFLRENGILVDVRINLEQDDEGENTK